MKAVKQAGIFAAGCCEVFIRPGGVTTSTGGSPQRKTERRSDGEDMKKSRTMASCVDSMQR